MKLRISLLTISILITGLAMGQSPDFFKELNPSGDGVGPDLQFTEMGGEIFFAGNSGTHGLEVWKTDGTDGGTVMVKDIRPGGASSEPRMFTTVGNRVIFLATTSAEGEELWATDGTANGTALLKNINNGSFDAMISEIYVKGDTAYFNADNSGDGNELWITDGTPSGTKFVKNISSGGSDSKPQGFTELNDLVYFVANDGITGFELWKTDGSLLGTERITDINPGSKSSFIDGNVHMAAWNGKLYFGATNSGANYELWESAGDSASTMLLKEIYNGSNASSPSHFAALDNYLLFIADDNFIGKELYRTNGTDTGTVLIKNIGNGTSSSQIDHIAVGKNWAFFAASDGFSGREMWRTNGEVAATQKVVDTYSPGSGMIEGTKDPLTVGDTAYFLSTSPEHGSELWRTDGNDVGTWMLRDINLGVDSGYPVGMFATEDIFLFGATDANRGRELWKMCMTFDGALYPYDSAFACPGEDGEIYLNDAGSLNVTWFKDSVAISNSGDTLNTNESATYYTLLADGQCAQYSNSVGFGHYDAPDTPTISQVDSIFSTQLFTTYQWYRNDTLLGGETNQSIEATINGDYHVVVSDGNGCTAESETKNWIKPPTGIHGSELISRIYPNPAQDKLYLQFREMTDYRIVNLMGQVMEVGQGVNEQVDLSLWPRGMYIVHLQNNSNTPCHINILVQ